MIWIIKRILSRAFGKMECHCPQFVATMRKLLGESGGLLILMIDAA